MSFYYPVTATEWTAITMSCGQDDDRPTDDDGSDDCAQPAQPPTARETRTFSHWTIPPQVEGCVAAIATQPSPASIRLRGPGDVAPIRRKQQAS